ncbi:hypothetical protein [Aurantiacibacter sp. MUD61]|uniref:hypothetical protein n=1 Tax=Aurantiacibacter sp. MUD61 TaxID=3009083 RepID=UPI0022F036F3|nr:hypothetical protein [Aurantiacibacter sp. MUD61]
MIETPDFPPGFDLAEFAKSTIETHRRIRRQRSDPYLGWLAIIAELRMRDNCSIFEAERTAISNKHLRRWVERAINAGNPARKYALAHIRFNGAKSLIECQGDSFIFRIPPP